MQKIPFFLSIPYVLELHILLKRQIHHVDTPSPLRSTKVRQELEPVYYTHLVSWKVFRTGTMLASGS